MKIVFLRDFRGVLAYEHVYRDGEEADLPDEIAQHLVDKGKAASVAALQAAILADLEVANSQASDDGAPEFEAVEEPEKPKKGKSKAAIYG